MINTADIQTRKIKCIKTAYDHSLTVGAIYTLDAIIEYEYATIIKIKEFPHMEFNSNCFDEIETTKVYSMRYFNPKRGYNGYCNYLGEFIKIKNLRQGKWADDFIGFNIETEEVCLIFTTETRGPGGGITSQVIPIPELEWKQIKSNTMKINSIIDSLESCWKVELDNVIDGRYLNKSLTIQLLNAIIEFIKSIGS